MNKMELCERLEDLRKYIKGAYVLAYGGANGGAVAQLTYCLNVLDTLLSDLR